MTKEDIEAFYSWHCAACLLSMTKRRAFGHAPKDATKPHPGKVWQVDSLHIDGGLYVALFADVSTGLRAEA